MESSKVTFRITSIILSIYPVVILILKSGYELLYKIWSSFGSGPMQLEGKIIPFGDLIHLTAAASCNQNPTIGSLVCDPWGRPLNQNIIVIRLIKTLHLTNITILGILTYLFFAVIVLAYIKRIECIGLSVPIFMFSPPLILAVDRGNEIVTLLLILSGLLLIVRESICFSSLGALLLSFSAIFKLWPVVLILSLIIYSNRNLKAHIKVLLGMSIVYWLINLDMVRAILRATQHGSPFGNSFGLKLFWNPELNSLQTALLLVLAVLLIGLFWVVNETNFDQFRIEITNAQYGFFLVPNFFTYFTIWAVGDSFSYRVIVLLPAVLILSQKKLNQSKTAKRLLLIILATSLTARLPIFIAISSSLALYLLLFCSAYVFFDFKNKSIKSV